MAKMCEVCGKAPVFGNRVSHAHNVSSRRWMPNLQRVRILVHEQRLDRRTTRVPVRHERPHDPPRHRAEPSSEIDDAQRA